MKQQGELSELDFMRLMYSLNFIVSKPFGDNAKYDFIVDNNGTLNRVQVKSVNHVQSTGAASSNTRYRVLLAHGSKSKKKYSKTDIDLFAIHVIPTNDWYFIPVEEVKSIRISLQDSDKSKFSNRRSFIYKKWKNYFKVFS